MNHFQDKVSFIWSIAELLRGDYKQAEYGKIILPFTVLRRLDCVLTPTREKVLEKAAALKSKPMAEVDPVLKKVAKQAFYNTSKFDFAKLKADPEHIAKNLRHFINGFSPSARDILDRFEFEKQIAKLDEKNLLYMVLKRFADIDFHPSKVSNEDMGYIFEELIRKFSEQSNETAGEHFTPREVIRLMVNLLFIEDGDALTKKGVVKTLYDPACGTGGMLSVAEEYLRELNPESRLIAFGQELNDESWAICKSDMLMKGQEPDNIKRGNSFSEDGLPSEKFDYMLSNPPFGVEWKKVEDEIRKEFERLGFEGRFGAGLPRINDGSLLFLQHMLSKMKTVDKGGTRLAIVFNASPLFTGSAGSGESEIRRWIIENDWLEAIIALPDQLFYNTGIYTYFWVLTNRKSKSRKGKIQLVNAVGFFQKMRKSLGNKRHEISQKQIEEITRIYGDFKEGKFCKIFDNDDFGYNRITVERPLKLSFQITPERMDALREAKAFQSLASSRKQGTAKEREIEEGRALQEAIVKALSGIGAKTFKSQDAFEKAMSEAFKTEDIRIPAPVKKAIIGALGERDETAEVVTDAKGNALPDPEFRDYENVPSKEDIDEYFKREVLPYVPDAWIDRTKTKKGYEIPVTRQFYEYKPMRGLEEISGEIEKIESEIQAILKGVL